MNRRALLVAASAAGVSRAGINRLLSGGRLNRDARRIVPDTEPDAELIALGAEIVRRGAERDIFEATRIEPFENTFHRLMNDWSQASVKSAKAAYAFSKKCGRDDAIDELTEFDKATDVLFRRLMAIPAATHAGRAAKVRALFIHVMSADWRGPAQELDWDKEMARSLLAEFAGMTEAEIAAV